MRTVTLKNKFQPDTDQKQQKAFCSACSNRIIYIYRINMYFFLCKIHYSVSSFSFASSQCFSFKFEPLPFHV